MAVVPQALGAAGRGLQGGRPTSPSAFLLGFMVPKSQEVLVGS